jgi:cation-transporting P-type ATPase C
LQDCNAFGIEKAKRTEFIQAMIICHSIPGRIRIKSDAIKGSSLLAKQLENRLQKADSILSAQVRALTGSVILFYDAEIRDPETLRDLTFKQFQEIAKESRKLSKPEHKIKRSSVRQIRSGWSLKYLLMNTVLISCFLGYVLIRKFILKSPIPRGRWGLAGLITALGSLPLLTGTMDELVQKKRPGLLTFLSIACFSAMLAGEVFTALEIVWLLSFGMFLEEYVKKQAHRAIEDILQVAPPKTRVLVNGFEEEIAVTDLKERTIIVARVGDRLPADGKILKGIAVIDEAHITGRALPEIRKKNDSVYAGTRVQEGEVHIRAEKVGRDTYLAGIFHLVETALAEPSESQRKADVLAARLVKFGWGSTLGTLLLTGNLLRAMSVMLVMSCPCATVLAASTAVSAGIANAARRNILVKGGDYLEQFKNIETVCFDKTGTITLDTPQVVEIIPRNPKVKPETVLALAAAAEAESNHPVGQAIVKEARLRKIPIKKPQSTQVKLGLGIKAKTDAGMIRVGNRLFFKSAGINTSDFDKAKRKYALAGQTTVFVGRNKVFEGMIVLSNSVRAETSTVLEWLHKNGIGKIYLISGDLASAVKPIAESQPFDGFKAELLPEAKARFIDSLENSGQRVIMVGDGINDALALSKAAVGVAMGAGGSEVAIETADIALANSDLAGLVRLRQLSEQTHRIVEMNFWLATASNIAGVILGFAGRFSPVMAGIFHVGHTVGIMANSGRLLNWEASAESRRS